MIDLSHLFTVLFCHAIAPIVFLVNILNFIVTFIGYIFEPIDTYILGQQER